MKFSKRNLFVIGLTLVVCAAVYVNWKLAAPASSLNLDALTSNADKTLGEAKLVDGTSSSITTIATDEYFSDARLSRKKAREEAAETLQNLYADEKADQSVRTKAQQDLLSLAGYSEKEAAIETLVKAKGFKECVAVISNDSANIIVKTEGLAENQPVIIKDIVVSETGLTADKVKIIEMK